MYPRNSLLGEVTIQPTGAVFDPPAPISFPNVDGHAPGAEVEMYSYDHDLEEFVTIGLGTVSADGSVIESNPGVGVVKAGWHGPSLPVGNGDACSCGICKKCVNGECQNMPKNSNHGQCVVCDGSGGHLTLSGLDLGCQVCAGINPVEKLEGVTIAASTSTGANGIMAVLNEPITFTATAQAHPKCTTKTYNWTFDDGTTATGATVTKTYATAGTYTVQVEALCSGCPTPKARVENVEVQDLKLEINEWNTDGAVPLDNHQKTFISTVPAMPTLTAKIIGIPVGVDGASVVKDVRWDFSLDYPDAGQFLAKTLHLAGDAKLDITAQLRAMRGGDLTVSATVNGKFLTKTILIRGADPSKAGEIQPTLGTATLQKIACQESRQRQFISGLPYLSSDGKLGSGIMQVTPASIENMWDWRTNISSGIAQYNWAHGIASKFAGAVQGSNSLENMRIRYNEYHATEPGFVPVASITVPAYTAGQLRFDSIRGYNGFAGSFTGSLGIPLVGFVLHEYKPAYDTVNNVIVLDNANGLTWQRVLPAERPNSGDRSYVDNVERRTPPVWSLRG